MTIRFHDRHEWIDFLKANEVARRIVADPSMIADARRFVATRMEPDPHQLIEGCLIASFAMKAAAVRSRRRRLGLRPAMAIRAMARSSSCEGVDGYDCSS